MHKKAFLILLAVFLGISFFPGKARAQDSSQDGCTISGIFYQQNNPVVIIGNELYKLNDTISGGVIVRIATDKVAIKFEDEEREFGIGQSVCQEVARKEILIKTNQLKASLDAIVLAAKSFTGEFKKNIAFPGSGSVIRVAIENSREQLAKVTVPLEGQRLYLLAVKALDIADEACLAAVASDKKQEKVLSARLKRVFEELDAEYSRVSP